MLRSSQLAKNDLDELELYALLKSLETDGQQATIEELRAILRDCHPAVRLIVNGGNRRRADLDKAEDALTRINAALAKAGDET